MTYRCGIGQGLEELGFRPGGPHIRCDGFSCQATIDVVNRHGLPTGWFMNRKAPPRWRSQRYDDSTGNDFCPECVALGYDKFLKPDMRLEAFYRGPTLTYSYAVETDAGVKRSYEVHGPGPKGTRCLRRFLFLDLGEANRDLALTWAEGYAVAQARAGR